ncbi:dihydrofolate reductase [Paracoccus caeni]|uniref:Dihydrofolate reductase n=1 Tax=Paracoccus caeni TaxID=657651 RepID=A0A934SAG8_9RHOB|nr:dihydrofolate reductase [Paracoccus caeni]MBK4215345.1 dihydrofolate reductase [Paracoccus caeni]
MLTLIVARARDNAIGKDNQIPWHIPQDLKMFQRETTGGALIMGRLTWDSLPVRPLKNRLNCVLSRQSDIAEHVFPDTASAIRFCEGQGHFRIYGIGGEAVFREMLPIADRLLLTEVDIEVPGAEAYFPPFTEDDWQEITAQALESEPKAVVRELIRRR